MVSTIMASPKRITQQYDGRRDSLRAAQIFVTPSGNDASSSATGTALDVPE